MSYGFGFGINSIKGQAKVGAGLTARILDGSVARLEPFSEQIGTLKGWKPVIERQPIEFEGEISVEANVHPLFTLSMPLKVLSEIVLPGIPFDDSPAVVCCEDYFDTDL